jgi:glycosyltransferase involved in cell wall biosynthesis
VPTPISFVPTISVIVPTYEEAENLPLLIPQIAATMRTKGWAWEVIIVDDNSKDATRSVLDQLSARFPQLRYLIRTDERGLSSAVLAGLQLAQHDYIVVMDADLSHPPEAIPSLVEKLLLGNEDEADFVLGSRYVEGGKTEDWSRVRALNSWGATMLAKPLVGIVKDPMAGFFAMRRETLRHADPLNPIGYKIGLELLVKTHVKPQRTVEVPITFRNRVHGESKLTLREQFRYLEHLSRLYDYRFPKGSPRAKFVIAAGCGTIACFATLGILQRIEPPMFMWRMLIVSWPMLCIAGGLAAMILVTLAFFARYVRTQRDFLVMRNPYTEFGCISMAEFLTAWAFAVATQANIYVQMTMGLVILLLVRYTLRKVFLHDLRGIRGTPKEKATLRLALAPRPQNSAASA